MSHLQAADGEHGCNATAPRVASSVVTGGLISRRDVLIRLGGAALGAAALTVIGPSSPATARTAPPFALVADYGAEIAAAWYELALELVKTTPGFTPPVVARVFGYMGVALYEAVRPGIPGAHSLAGQLNELTHAPLAADSLYHWPTVANSALATALGLLMPSAAAASLASFQAQEAAIRASFKPTPPWSISARSMQRGRAVAEHIVAWARQDGGHEGHLRNFPSDYTPPVGPGRWRPTPPGFQSALQPYWGQNRPFVLATARELDPGPPPAYSEEPGSACYSEAFEVFSTVNQLTSEQHEIALFWADDPGVTATPPGHSIAILTQTLRQLDAGLDVAAEAYARVGVAVADAFIACWNCKYHYHLLRPITYIQRVIDPAWGNPLPISTPPFPEYTSGHSVQTAAAAQVLHDLFGDLPFTDHTHAGRGYAPRSFDTWSALADEAAMSRLYGGIHFRAGIELGIAQGRQIGRKVGALTFVER